MCACTEENSEAEWTAVNQYKLWQSRAPRGLQLNRSLIPAFTHNSLVPCNKETVPCPDKGKGRFVNLYICAVQVALVLDYVTNDIGLSLHSFQLKYFFWILCWNQWDDITCAKEWREILVIRRVVQGKRSEFDDKVWELWNFIRFWWNWSWISAGRNYSKSSRMQNTK